MDMENAKTLGARIAALRKSKGLTQEELAERIGVSPQAISKWENDVSCPDIMMIPKLAKLFGVTADALLTGEEAETRPVTRCLPPEERKAMENMMLRIKVDSSDGDRVRVNLPIALLRVFVESGINGSAGNISLGKMGELDVDWDTVMKLVESGVVGKLVEITSADGDEVEIVVE